MKASQSRLSSLLITIVLLIGALFLLGLGLLMGVAALVSFSSGKSIQTGSTIFLAAFGFEGLVLLAAAFFSFQKYLQKPSADQSLSIPISSWLIAVCVSVIGGSIAIGYVISTNQALDWLILPFLTIPAVVLPLVVLLGFGTSRLPFGTRSQTWSVLGLAMTLGPVILFITEIFAAIVIFLGAIVYVSTQPALAARLQALSQQIMNLGPRSPAVVDLLSPFFTKPGVIVTVLIYMSVLVPALEELFKPLGVWFFAGLLESPAQGFALGALSGAGYALIETVGVSGQTTGDWASLLFSRIGTGLLHVTTSALMGGAIVQAWRERRYARLLGTYLLAILLHGSWNALALLFTFSNVAQTLGQAGRLSSLQPVIMGAMVLLAAVLFVILVLNNRRMQRTLASPPAPVAPPDESI